MQEAAGWRPQPPHVRQLGLPCKVQPRCSCSTCSLQHAPPQPGSTRQQPTASRPPPRTLASVAALPRKSPASPPSRQACATASPSPKPRRPSVMSMVDTRSRGATRVLLTAPATPPATSCCSGRAPAALRALCSAAAVASLTAPPAATVTEAGAGPAAARVGERAARWRGLLWRRGAGGVVCAGTAPPPGAASGRCRPAHSAAALRRRWLRCAAAPASRCDSA